MSVVRCPMWATGVRTKLIPGDLRRSSILSGCGVALSRIKTFSAVGSSLPRHMTSEDGMGWGWGWGEPVKNKMSRGRHYNLFSSHTLSTNNDQSRQPRPCIHGKWARVTKDLHLHPLWLDDDDDDEN